VRLVFFLPERSSLSENQRSSQNTQIYNVPEEKRVRLPLVARVFLFLFLCVRVSTHFVLFWGIKNLFFLSLELRLKYRERRDINDFDTGEAFRQNASFAFVVTLAARWEAQFLSESSSRETGICESSEKGQFFVASLDG